MSKSKIYLWPVENDEDAKLFDAYVKAYSKKYPSLSEMAIKQHAADRLELEKKYGKWKFDDILNDCG